MNAKQMIETIKTAAKNGASKASIEAMLCGLKLDSYDRIRVLSNQPMSHGYYESWVKVTNGMITVAKKKYAIKDLERVSENTVRVNN